MASVSALTDSSTPPAWRGWLSTLLLGCVLLVTLLTSVQAQATTLRELTSFGGVRENQLVGYGLVVGLDGTGDQTTQAPFTSQSLVNMLSQLGVSVPEGTSLQLRNVAAVMVTASLPAFARPGQDLDIVVSSIANASSLRGGTLLMTPLKGADGDTYAVAQGNMLVGGAGADAGGSSVQINQQAAGRIPGGATVEREVALDLGANGGQLELQLDNADFGTAQRMVAAINADFGREVAAARNGGVIALDGPEDANGRVNFMARIQSVEVTPVPARARVVINSRTGSVVINQRVTLERAAVAHGNLSITIDTQYGVSQPAPLSDGQTVVAPQADIEIEEQEAFLRVVEGADLNEVVNALNALGASPQDLMSILEALRASGALRAELVII